jgi:hypothetical protein
MLAAGVLAAGVWVATPACATGYQGSYGAQRDYRDFERIAYDNGYREGRSHGEHDARDRRDYRVDRDGDYRHADDGYRREYGDRDFYRQSFRRGYEVGYREGYRRDNSQREYRPPSDRGYGEGYRSWRG